jgi:glycosyltransferase involved in cell wall biosynthesis
MQDVSIILPLYNEEGNAHKIIQKLHQSFPDSLELIVIDDGSTDNTVQEIPLDKCIFIKHEVNLGKGAAIRSALQKCNRDIVAFIDGDMQDDPNDLIEVCNLVRSDADMAIGSRFIHDTKNKRYSDKAVLPVNQFGNKFLTFIINTLFNGELTDTQASIKAFKTHKIKNLEIISSRYEIETELVVRSLCAGYNIREYPVKRYEREHGISNLFDIPFGRFKFALRALRIIAKGFIQWKMA